MIKDISRVFSKHKANTAQILHVLCEGLLVTAINAGINRLEFLATISKHFKDYEKAFEKENGKKI